MANPSFASYVEQRNLASSTGNSQSLTSNPAGSNLVAFVGCGYSDVVSGQACTYDGDAMSLLYNSEGGPSDRGISIWAKVVAAGSKTVSITWSGNRKCSSFCVVYKDAPSGLSFRDTGSNTDDGSSPNRVTLSGLDSGDDLIVSLIYSHDNNEVTPGGYSNRGSPAHGGGGSDRSIAIADALAPGASANVDWTFPSQSMDQYAVALIAAVATTFTPQTAFFFSMAGLAIPAAMGKIVVPAAELIEKLT